MSGSQVVGLRRTSLLSILVCGIAITACGGGGGSGSAASTSTSTGASAGTNSVATGSTSGTASSTTNGQVSSTSQDAALKISGSPMANVNVGSTYSFVPAAQDANGNPLTFSIQNKPAWATFDSGTGALSGAPAAGDVSTYSNIVITVSNGATNVALPAFSIAVTQIAPGSVQLSWTPPTQNTDDSALSNIAGYRIYYGTDPNQLDQLIIVDKAATSYVVENLAAAQWYFAVSAYTTEAFESDTSNVVTKTVVVM